MPKKKKKTQEVSFYLNTAFPDLIFNQMMIFFIIIVSRQKWLASKPNSQSQRAKKKKKKVTALFTPRELTVEIF